MTVPNLINDWGLNEVLRRRYNVQEGAPAPTMAMECFPVVQVAPFTPELLYLSGWRLCGGYADVAAAVGNPSQLILSNPAASRVLAVIDKIRSMSSGTGLYCAFYAGNLTGSLGAANSIPLDTRHGYTAVTTLTSCILSAENASAVAAGSRFFDWIPATSVNTTHFRDDPLVLSPGYSLLLYGTGNNIAISASVRWRERRMLPGE